jgi:hypothetical protein
MEKDNSPIQLKFYELQFPFENKVFFYNKSHVYKGHKIFLAVYMATEHQAFEPLMQGIRQAALSFFSSFFSNQPHVLQNEGTRLLALIESAAFLKMISSSNATILSAEIANLLATIAETSAVSRINLDKEFFGVPAVQDQPLPTFIQRDIKDNKGHYPLSPIIPQKKALFLKDTSSAIPSDRTTKIISFLKEKGPVSIRDIRSVIKDISEKTIQRELAQLVNQGLVTRTGERRWSTYALKS